MDLTVAEIIKGQIGHEAVLLLGAKNFVGDDVSLQFQVKGSPKKVTSLTIKLDGSDCYTVTAHRVTRKWEVIEIAKLSGIYVEQLHDTIEEVTGLFVSLRRRTR